jgi:hypothetical protein
MRDESSCSEDIVGIIAQIANHQCQMTNDVGLICAGEFSDDERDCCVRGLKTTESQRAQRRTEDDGEGERRRTERRD